jgi:hypothetical protein
MNNQDERLGLPSCSNFDRYASCPGSYLLEKECPPLPEEDWTKSGTRIHDFLAGFEPGTDFTGDEQETAEKINELVKRVFETVEIPANAVCYPEIRRWIGNRDFDQDSKLASGKPDKILTWWTESNELHACIIDYKTGRLEVDPAPSNAQLKGLVAAFAYERSPQKVWVAIVGPFQSPQISIAVYDQKAILQAQLETWDLIDSINKADARRYPGDHCRYCRAKAVCPELQGVAVVAPKQLGVVDSTVAKAAVVEAARGLSDDKLAMLMEGYQLRQWANEAIHDETKRRVSLGQTVGYWGLSKPQKREKITDLGTVFARSQEFCSVQEFQDRCSISKKELGELVKAKQGLKGKALDTKMKELVAGCVIETTTEPSLVRKPKELNEPDPA